MIEAHHLKKTFGQTESLKNVTFKVEEGQILGFLGPNGAGKTTTMKILTGLLRPTSGWGTVAGFDVVKDSEKIKPMLGYLPEDSPAYPEMRIKDFLEFVAGVKNIPSKVAKKQIHEALEEVELLKDQNRLICNISKGMRQRVGLAQSTLGDPKIVILDEPTVGLDPSQISHVRDLIKRMKGRRTVLFSTHILPNVSEVCTHAVILSQGEIIASGPVDEIGKDTAASSLFLTIKGTQSELRSILETFLDAKLDDSAEFAVMDDKVSCRIKADDVILNRRSELSRKLIQNGFDLLDFTVEKPTLEDIFLRAVSQTSQQKALVSS